MSSPVTTTSWWLEPSSLLAVHLYTPKSSLCSRLSLRVWLGPSWLESPVTRGSPSLVQMTCACHMSHNIHDMMSHTCARGLEWTTHSNVSSLPRPEWRLGASCSTLGAWWTLSFTSLVTASGPNPLSALQT